MIPSERENNNSTIVEENWSTVVKLQRIISEKNLKLEAFKLDLLDQSIKIKKLSNESFELRKKILHLRSENMEYKNKFDSIYEYLENLVPAKVTGLKDYIKKEIDQLNERLANNFTFPFKFDDLNTDSVNYYKKIEIEFEKIN